MSDPVGRNRLDEEQSPYLRQHANNPVNWQPWDETALDAACEADKPILLSIGYSAYHWRHVMADESFSDPDIAGVLNEEFVPVKVDHEERPDLDHIYQTICQQVTGGGGWPLSVWFTSEGKSFPVGTYFSSEPRRGAPSFRDTVESFAELWLTDREEIENRAEQWTSAIIDRPEETPDTPGEAPGLDILDTTVQAAPRGADCDHGSFGGDGPEFPQPDCIGAMLHDYAASGHREALDVTRQSLDVMASGGLRDHLGGGFHRYCVDREWTTLHFEEMLYNQAGLVSRYLDAARLTGNDSYATVTVETFEFVRRELTRDDGGFFAALDAQSGGGEGTFYVRMPDDVRDLLPELDTDLFCDRYGVTLDGNSEDKTTVLNVSAMTADLADEYDLDEFEIEDRSEKARKMLFATRGGCECPARDEKVFAGWNSPMISMFAQDSVILEDDSLAAGARRVLDFVRERLRDAKTATLLWRVMDGEVKDSDYPEGYAFLMHDAFDLYQVAGDLAPLSFALNLAWATCREFYDAGADMLYFIPESGESLVTRPQKPTDQSTPSSLGVATSLFLDLRQFAPDVGFGEVADAVLGSLANWVRGNPLGHASLALAAERAASGVPELVIAAGEVPDKWRVTFASRYFPGLVVSRRPGTDEELDAWLDELGLDEAPSIWAGCEAVDGEPTIYVCENFTYSALTHDLDETLAWFTAGEGA